LMFWMSEELIYIRQYKLPRSKRVGVGVEAYLRTLFPEPAIGTEVF
jgi:hypothetical protein